MLISILYYSLKKAIKYSKMFDPPLLPNFLHLKNMHTHNLIITSGREGGGQYLLAHSLSYVESATS